MSRRRKIQLGAASVLLNATGVVIYQQFFAPARATAASAAPAQLEHAMRMGPADARVQPIEYADFECPACGDFHQRLKDRRQRLHRGRVAEDQAWSLKAARVQDGFSHVAVSLMA